MQAQIQQGKLIKSVTPTGNGIVIEMSDGQKFEINNGKNGADAPATVVEIGKNGNWFINGKDTGKPSQGAKGDKGDKGEQGEQGEQGKPGKPGEGGAAAQAKYYKPGTDGYWYVVENGKETKTDMKWETAASQAGGIVAIKTGESLTLQNVQGAEGGQVMINLGAELKSLVFVPEFVLSGHQAMEYIYVPYKEHTVVDGLQTGNKFVADATHAQNAPQGEGLVQATEKYKVEKELNIATKFSFVNPYNDKAYHINPSNAIIPEFTRGANGFLVASEDLQFIGTRALQPGDPSANKAAAQPKAQFSKIVDSESADGGKDLIVGISMFGDKVKAQSKNDPEDRPAGSDLDLSKIYAPDASSKDMTLVSPAARLTNNVDDVVATTYGAVQASQFAPATLAFNLAGKAAQTHLIKELDSQDKVAYVNVAPNTTVDAVVDQAAKAHKLPWKGGYHLYQTIEEAVKHAPTVEIAWTNDKGINLNELVEAHFVSNSDLNWNAGHKFINVQTTKDLAYYGLKFEFELPRFEVGDNMTRQDQYAAIQNVGTDSYIYPCDVKSHSDIDMSNSERDLTTIGKGRAGIGRTPIVRVLLRSTMVAGSPIVKVGYIKFKIVAPMNPLETAPFNLGEYYYKCPKHWKRITWHAISNKLLGTVVSQHITTKAMFDNHYRVDVVTPIDQPAAPLVIQYLKTNKVDKNGKPIYEKDPLQVGEIRSLSNTGSESTDVFSWELSNADFRKLYFAKGYTNQYVPEIKISRLVKYVAVEHEDGDDTFAKEPIYLPLELTIRFPQGIMSNKLDKYWFADNSLVQAGVDLEKRNNVHVHVEVPSTQTEDTNAHPETPYIWTDLNSQFKVNGSTIGFPQYNQVINTYANVMKAKENAPIIDFTKAPDWNVLAQFPDFEQQHLVYYYYFTAKNNGKTVLTDKEGKVYKLFVKNVKANSPAMVYGEAAYEYNNVDLYAGLTAASAVRIAYIKHHFVTTTRGQVAKAEIHLEHNEMAQRLLNQPLSWDGKRNGVSDKELLEKTLDAQIGVVAFNKCDLNFPLLNNTFNTEILKPVYPAAAKDFEFSDAVDGGTEEYIFEHVYFYDWRVAKFADHLNYFNFYGVKSMTVDPLSIQTNLSGEFKPLREVSQDVEFHFIPNLNGTVPTLAECTLAGLKAHFGKLTYEDNRASVTDFEIKVPVVITHYWNDQMPETVWVNGTVKRTLNN